MPRSCRQEVTIPLRAGAVHAFVTSGEETPRAGETAKRRGDDDRADRDAGRAVRAERDRLLRPAALFINCTLKRSPEVSNTQGLMDISIEIMRRNGVAVESIRAVDHEIATGVWPDMTEHGWERRRVAGDLRAGDGRRHPRARDVDLAGREVLGRDPGRRAPLRQLAPAERRRPVRLLRAGRRLPGDRQRGRGQALRDEHPLLAAAPRLHDPAPGRRRLDRRGRARARPTWTRARAARRTTSPTATRPSPPGTCCTWRGC